jgi:predicted RNA-binding Zn-ribbon protein involved in translation (DUF1610 family)
MRTFNALGLGEEHVAAQEMAAAADLARRGVHIWECPNCREVNETPRHTLTCPECGYEAHVDDCGYIE